jgi:hypothetical protein
MSVYCESHVDGWYIDIALKCSPDTRTGRERWVFRLEWPTPPDEGGRLPRRYITSSSLRGAVTGLWEQTDLQHNGFVDELLDGLEALELRENHEITQAREIWST